MLELAIALDRCVVFDPHRPGGGLTAQQLRDATMILRRRPRISVDPGIATNARLALERMLALAQAVAPSD